MSNKIGFIWGEFEIIDYKYMSDILAICNNLVIGLFSDDLLYRINGKPSRNTYRYRESILKRFDFVIDVVEINRDNYNMMDVIDSIYDRTGLHPDVVFSGTEYGKLYTNDKALLRNNNIALEHYNNGSSLNVEHLRFILSNSYVNYRIVLFGTGKYFDNYMEQLGSDYKPIYAVDNDEAKWETRKSGIEIKNPKILKEDIKNVPNLLVIICAKNGTSIKEQILSYGDIDYRYMTASGQQALYDEWRVIFNDESKHIKTTQEILKNALFSFDDACNKLGVKYYLNCGSVIGAIRHNGFIPWDDDVDIIMEQSDFDKVKEHADELWPEGDDFKLVCPGEIGKGAWLDFMNRLMYVKEHIETNTFDKVKGKADSFVENTINLDIYIFNSTTCNIKKHRKRYYKLKTIYGFAMGHRAKLDFDLYKERYDRFTSLVVWITSLIGRIMPLRFILWLHDKEVRKYNDKDTEYCFESNAYGTHIIMRKDLFGAGRLVDFCGRKIPVPEKAEEYLEKHGYPNFMKYPPAYLRRPTHALKSPDLAKR